MNCPKCNEELDEDSTFCSSCGEKIETGDLKKCPSCGTSNKSDASFCNSCGYNFTTPQKIESNEVNRTPELILGIIGAVLGFLVSFIALFFSAFAESAAWVFISLVFFSILGLISCLYIRKYHEVGGIGMLISGVCLLFTGGTLGIISAFLFGIGGLLALVRK